MLSCWHGEKKAKAIEKIKVKFGGIKSFLYYIIKYQIIVIISLIYMELRFEEPRQYHPSFIFQVLLRKILKDKIGVVNI
jgi:hypothetical protein